MGVFHIVTDGYGWDYIMGVSYGMGYPSHHGCFNTNFVG